MEVAGLQDLLQQEGSYTIFAPTDEAFDGLSKEDLDLLKSESSPGFSCSLHHLFPSLSSASSVRTFWPKFDKDYVNI